MVNKLTIKRHPSIDQETFAPYLTLQIEVPYEIIADLILRA